MVRTGPIRERAPFALILAGPTAVGKSAVALALASELNAEIISLDSVQVYRHCNIGSAKPTEAERSTVPHHLIDILDPDARFDVGACTQRARQLIEEIIQRGRLPIIVASSGMYLTAMIHGLADAPSSDPEFRAQLELRSTPELYAELQQRDAPKAAALHRNDRVRIVRALEVVANAQPLSNLQIRHGHAPLLLNPLLLVLMRDRSQLYARIDARVQTMLDQGLLAETRELAERYPGCWPLKSIGYCECLQHLQGSLAADALAAAISQSTRRFAKRQITYLLNEPAKRGWSIRSGTVGSDTSEVLMVRHRGQLAVHLLDLAATVAMVQRHRSEPPNCPELFYMAAHRFDG